MKKWNYGKAEFVRFIIPLFFMKLSKHIGYILLHG